MFYLSDFKSRVLLIFSLVLLIFAWFAGHSAQKIIQQNRWADYLEQGNQAVSQKNYSLAFEFYQKAQLINPKLPASAQAGLGEVYFHAGQTQKAHQLLSEALRASPNLKKARELLTDIKVSEEALSADKSVTQKVNVAFSFLQKDAAFLALPILTQVTGSAPHYRDGHYLLAATYLKIGQKQKAQAELEKTLELDPNFEAGQQLQEVLQ